MTELEEVAAQLKLFEGREYMSFQEYATFTRLAVRALTLANCRFRTVRVMCWWKDRNSRTGEAKCHFSAKNKKEEELPPDYSWHGSNHKEPVINPGRDERHLQPNLM